MTEKTETTEIIEIKTLRFSWEGEEVVTRRERVLARNVRRWTRKDTWVEESPVSIDEEKVGGGR
jgi:hypothetical protein